MTVHDDDENSEQHSNIRINNVVVPQFFLISCNISTYVSHSADDVVISEQRNQSVVSLFLHSASDVRMYITEVPDVPTATAHCQPKIEAQTEYRLLAGVKAGCVHLCRMAGNTV